jgi:hypothetical protein
MMMGGRIAEEIVFKDITAGASSDIQRATELARKMVVEWGMSEKLGFMSFGSKNEVFIGRDYQVQNQYSDATARVIDDEVKAILDKCYSKAKKMLESKRDLLERMTELLLAEETIYSEEVDDLIAGKSSEEIINRLHEKEQKRKEKEEQIRKEQEYIVRERLQAIKLSTAEALKQDGMLSEEELARIRADYDRIVKEKEDFLAGKITESGEENTDQESSEKDNVENKESLEEKPKRNTTKKTSSNSEDKKTTTKSKTETTKKSTSSKTAKTKTTAKKQERQDTSNEKDQNKSDN